MTRTGSIATHRMVRLVLVWLGVGSLYILTAAGNRSEVDDAFAYADAVENASWSGLVSVAHTSHLLFLPGWRLSYAATSALGLDWRAYDVMRVANSFIAAGAVLMLFAVLHGRFGSSTFAAGAAAACFGLSYGFWRYANEGDAYPLAALAVLTYCWLVFSEDGGLQPAVLAGVAAAFAVLIHILGVIPAVTVAPIVYLATKRVGPLVAFVVTFGGVCLATTFSTFLIARDVAMSYPSYLVGERPVSYSAGAIVKSFVGLVPDLIGANFVFARGDVTSWLEQRVPTVDLREEAYAATRAPAALPATALALLLAMTVVGIYLLGRSLRTRPKLDARLVSIVVWVVLYWIVVVGRSPAAPESWIPLVTPIWILIGVMVFDRARDGPGRIAVVTFVALFVLENAIGGMAIVRPADADLTALRSSWLIAHAGAHDTILSGNGPIFDWYLAYNTPATVVPTGFKNRDQLTADYATAIARQGDVFATDTVFAPPPEYLAQDPAGFAAALRFARAIRPAFVVAYRSETGVVYVRSNGP